jgi:hypothetical protein
MEIKDKKVKFGKFITGFTKEETMTFWKDLGKWSKKFWIKQIPETYFKGGKHGRRNKRLK